MRPCWPAAAGILILPITTLSPSDYTLFIVPALGAALLARFTSFPVTVAAGLAIGMLQSELGKLQTVWTWLPQSGLQDGLPFILIMIAVVLMSKRIPARGTLVTIRNASIGRPKAPLRTTGISLVIGLVAILLFSQLYKYAFAASLNVACVALSVVVITGYVGQISLAQSAFAGIAAFEISHIGHGLGLGFPFALILGALCAVVVGVVIGLPAVRVRGVNLAIVDALGGDGAGCARLQLDLVQRRLHRHVGALAATCSGSTSASPATATRRCSRSSRW